MGKFDLGALLQQQAAPAEGRSIEVITQEILDAKRAGGEAILAIGKGLIEAKAMLEHGEWLPWLNEKVEFSERTANRFMRIAKEYSNPTLVSDLGARKALALLALPEAERKEFLSETHLVDGEEKNVIDMSSRQLEQAIREREEALTAKQQAEQARQKMEEDMKLSNQLLESARQEAKAAEEKTAELSRELEALKAAPVEVAIATVDQAALDRARAEGEAAKAAELAELQAKLDKAKEAKAKADDKRKEAETALDEAKAKLDAAEKAQNQAAALADPEVAEFKIYFMQAQETVNKLHGLLLKARKREDQSAAEKLTQALLALGEKIRGYAE